MKYILSVVKIIAVGFVLAAWLFGFQLAYDAHIKQIALSAWMGGVQSCQKESSKALPQTHLDTKGRDVENWTLRHRNEPQ